MHVKATKAVSALVCAGYKSPSKLMQAYALAQFFEPVPTSATMVLHSQTISMRCATLCSQYPPTRRTAALKAASLIQVLLPTFQALHREGLLAHAFGIMREASIYSRHLCQLVLAYRHIDMGQYHALLSLGACMPVAPHQWCM